MAKYCCTDCRKTSKQLGKRVSCQKEPSKKRKPPAGGQKWIEFVKTEHKKNGGSWKEALKRASVKRRETKQEE